MTLPLVLVLLAVVWVPSLPLRTRGHRLPAWAGAVGVVVWLAAWKWAT
jgi:hypothetical protein